MEQLQNVSVGSVSGMIFSLVVAFGIPIGLMAYLMRKKKADFFSFATGLIFFILFALFLENIAHSVVFSATGALITGNLFFYALYAGLMAALFEETGRYLAMRYVMRRHLTKENALMYGVGHGGIEAMFLLGLTSINNLVNATMINSGAMTGVLADLDEAACQTAVQSLAALWQTPAYLFFAAGFERVMAILLHISLSVLVFRCVREKNARWYGAAFGAHFAVDFATVLMASYSIVMTELMLALMTAAVVWYAVRAYREVQA